MTDQDGRLEIKLPADLPEGDHFDHHHRRRLRALARQAVSGGDLRASALAIVGRQVAHWHPGADTRGAELERSGVGEMAFFAARHAALAPIVLAAEGIRASGLAHGQPGPSRAGAPPNSGRPMAWPQPTGGGTRWHGIRLAAACSEPLRDLIGDCSDRGRDPHRREMLPVSYEAPTLAP